MQYFATTVASSPKTPESATSKTTDESTISLSSDDDIIWVPQRSIQEESSILGESSGNVIGSIATNEGHGDQQLQCIVSKCNATLSYVFYNEQTQQEEETETNIVIPVSNKRIN